MQIFIQHQGQQTGPFPVEQIRTGLAHGIYQPTDLAWYEGAAGWMPLTSIPALFGGVTETAQSPVEDGKTSALAITSLVLGILSFITLGLTAIPAVICGHVALRKIKRSAGRQAGGGLALGGVICGYFGLFLFIALLAGLTAPLVIRQRQKAEQTQAISNARQIGIALFEFETEYGSFPNASTAGLVATNTDTAKETGTSANAYFRQLIRSGIAQSEMIFYAKSSGTHKPDGNITGSHCLESGECGFALIASDSKSRPSSPILISPLIPGTDRFDRNTYGGMAVILSLDNSVKSLPIDRKTGHVMLNGMNLLDPANPVWGGKPPVIALPE